MRSFASHRPKSLKEAIFLLGKHGEKAAPLAGGTGWLVDLLKRTKSLSQMIDIKGIPSLGEMVLDGERVIRAEDFFKSPFGSKSCPLGSRN